MRLRQLASLYLRGSLANETMKNLTDEEKKELTELTVQISSHELLQAHRCEFINQLRRTIGGDYFEDIKTAEAEYEIAIWRGIVQLLYHKEYNYKCLACNNSTYLQLNGKTKTFDRKYDICPNCKKVKTPNGFVDSKTLNKTQQSSSPIISIPGNKKIKDGYLVLEDPIQLKRFFSEFIWNYFKQIIMENKIKQQSQSYEVYESADKIFVNDLIRLTSKYKINTSINNECNIIIMPNCLTAPLDFNIALAALINKFMKHGLSIEINNTTIKVISSSNKLMVSKITDNTPITMVTKIKYGDKELDIIDQTKDPQIDQSHFEYENAVATIRNSLKDDKCKQMFDLFAYSTQKPKLSKIAKELQVTNKQISLWMTEIKIKMITHGLTPIKQ